jgi:feruloyl esterase
MPTSNWNEKYQGQGNGGFAGQISYSLMAGALAQGYATSGTDTGHQGEGTDATWALKHPEKIIDFGYRGIHEMTLKAKALIQEYYARTPQRSFFDSCSDGGREALMEAQRFPEDYDGIIAGAPANYWSHMMASGSDVTATVLGDPANYIPPAKIPAISAAVLNACDAQDGVKDGILNDPRKCHFDPSALRCQGAESDACLTDHQIVSLNKIYAGGRNSKGRSIFPGLLPGAEEGEGGWKNWVLGSSKDKGEGSLYVNGYFRNMVYDNPEWTFRATTVDMNVQTADEKTGHAVNSIDPNLGPFLRRGGKLILYHGWNDPAIGPVNTIHYYESVVAKLGQAQTEKFVRLYMVPGMQHCIGGPGPSYFGQFSTVPGKDPKHSMHQALEQWVERGVGPSDLVATKYTDGNPGKGVQMTRPLCPYPQFAQYKGVGSTDDVANFVCTTAVK